MAQVHIMPDSSSSLLRKAGLLGASYVLGAFNDNYYKQAALLLAVQAGLVSLQSTATLLFALPFVLLSPAAGWLADRYAKKHLVVLAKAVEIVAMLAGAWGLLTLNWFWILAMVCGMGFNSTLFSPALNGSIPELFASHDVPRVNALFKLGTTAAILLGIALAGPCLELGGHTAPGWWPAAFAGPLPLGRAVVAGGALLVAVAGFVCTFAIPLRPGAGSTNPFPWLAVIDMARDLSRLRSTDPTLLTVLCAQTFFYFLSTLFLLEINRLGVGELGLSLTTTSLLSVSLMAGIGGGSLLAARGNAESWRTLAVPCLCAMALCLGLAALAAQWAGPAVLPALLGLYSLAGVAGGLYLIPLASFIQLRPASTDRGRVLGLANTLDFSGLLGAGYLYHLLTFVSPSTGHMLLAGLTACAAIALRWRVHQCHHQSSRTI